MYRRFSRRRAEAFSSDGRTYDIRVYQSPVSLGFAVMIFKSGNQVGDMYLVDEGTVTDAAASPGADLISSLIDTAKADIIADAFGKFA